MVFHILYYLKDNIKILLCLNLARWDSQLELRYNLGLLVLPNLNGFIQEVFTAVLHVQPFSNVELYC